MKHPEEDASHPRAMGTASWTFPFSTQMGPARSLAEVLTGQVMVMNSRKLATIS